MESTVFTQGPEGWAMNKEQDWVSGEKAAREYHRTLGVGWGIPRATLFIQICMRLELCSTTEKICVPVHILLLVHETF